MLEKQEKGGNMDCPYYKNEKAKRVCKASFTLLSPDAEEADKYCTTEEHYRCPLLLASVLRGNSDLILAV